MPTRAATIDARTKALMLAARALCDERTAARALRDGVEVIRTLVVRERVRAAMSELGLDGHGAVIGDGHLAAHAGSRIGD